MKMYIDKFLSVILSFMLITLPVNITTAQEHRSVTVGETTVEYVYPTPPELTLTPPRILTEAPPEARMFELTQGQPAPFTGILLNNQASAWLIAEQSTVASYFETYGNNIRAQMVAWAYLQIDEANLRLATDMETSRMEILQLERELRSMRDVDRRSRIRPVLITGFIVLSLGVAGTVSGYFIGKNNN